MTYAWTPSQPRAALGVHVWEKAILVLVPVLVLEIETHGVLMGVPRADRGAG